MLEHVLEPELVVAEIHRVLMPDGLVYAGTPFMQQVHEGPYDFMRFTESGHRWLFRRFERLASGATGGPGAAGSGLFDILSPDYSGVDGSAGLPQPPCFGFDL